MNNTIPEKGKVGKGVAERNHCVLTYNPSGLGKQVEESRVKLSLGDGKRKGGVFNFCFSVSTPI